MRKRTLRLPSVALALAILLATMQSAFAQLCTQYQGGEFTEDFNTLPMTGASNTSSAIPIGWAFSESGTGSNITFAADNGSLGTANTYSYGSTGSPDRAFGELNSTVFQTTLGTCIVNNSHVPIRSFTVGYTGEVWRLGVDGGAVDRLDFQYSVDATSLTDAAATWINVDALDFPRPATVVGPAGAKNGNDAANRSVIGPVKVTPVFDIPHGATFFMRWVPLQLAGANDGLAIDDFKFEAGICSLDVNGDIGVDPLTDGLIIMRAMFGLTGANVTAGTITPGSQRTTWEQIRQHLNRFCGTTFNP